MSSYFDRAITFSKFISLFVEKSRDVFWMRNADYSQQIYISPAYEKIWGRSCDELYQFPEKWSDYLYPSDRERLDNSIAKRNSKSDINNLFIENYRIVRPDGEIRWIKDYSFPLHEQNQLIGFAGIAQDISAEILREENLRKEKEQFEIANKIKSMFLASISNQPNNTIDEILSLLRKTSAEKYFINGRNGEILLSKKELVCLIYTAKGKLAKEIASILKISPKTVEFHISNLKNKLGCYTKAQLVEIFLKIGLDL
jgi:PAS domain S-box-containing protein